MYKVLVIIMFLTSINSKAQTILSLNVIPAQPSENTEVKVAYHYAQGNSACGLDSTHIAENALEFLIEVFHKKGLNSSECHSYDTITLGKLQSGVYSLELIARPKGGSPFADTASLQFTVQPHNSIKSNSIEQLLVSPNPAFSQLKISVGPGDSKIISIKNLNGQTIFEKQVFQEETIYCGDWPRGIYIFTTKSSNAQSYQLLMIQ